MYICRFVMILTECFVILKDSFGIPAFIIVQFFVGGKDCRECICKIFKDSFVIQLISSYSFKIFQVHDF